MPRDPLEDSAQSFADLVMNLLAVLIVITMIALIFVASQATPTQYAVDRPATRDRVFPMLRLVAIARLSTLYYVDADRVSLIHLERLGAAAERAEDGVAEGTADLLDDGWPPVEFVLYAPSDAYAREPAEFDLTLTLPEAPPAAPAASLDAQLARVRETSYDLGRAPNFLVSPTGYGRFAEIERRLVKSGVCFRWYPAVEREVRYYRSAAYFSTVSARRCPP